MKPPYCLARILTFAVTLKVSNSEFVKEHPFVAFYAEKLAILQEMVAVEGLPQGILHGDPFLDNVLVDPITGNFSGLR